MKIFSYNSQVSGTNIINLPKEILYKLFMGQTKLLYNIHGPILFIIGKDDLNLSKILFSIINKLQEAVFFVML